MLCHISHITYYIIWKKRLVDSSSALLLWDVLILFDSYTLRWPRMFENSWSCLNPSAEATLSICKNFNVSKHDCLRYSTSTNSKPPFQQARRNLWKRKAHIPIEICPFFSSQAKYIRVGASIRKRNQMWFSNLNVLGIIAIWGPAHFRFSWKLQVHCLKQFSPRIWDVYKTRW